MRPLRIAHVSATFAPYQGGTGNVCLQNARELLRRGHQVTVFTAAVPGAPATEQREGIQIRRLRPLARIGNAPVLAGLLGALHGFELIHLHYPFYGGELAALAASLRGIPLVITYHQDVLLSGLMGTFERLLRHSFGRATLRSAARVLFTTLDYAQASYARELLRGRESRIGELPNGVDILRFQPGPAPQILRARHRLPDTARIALLVAGLDRAHAFKGVENFLRALPEQASALIIGDGELRSQYESLAAALGLSRRVVFAGRVSDAELADYYRLADVTVLPSTTMGEAFGLVLLESLACATPVIASNLPGVRTVVAHGQDGLLVPAGQIAELRQALQQILDPATDRRAMGLRGRTRVAAQYAWPQIAAQLEAIYQQVLAERQPANWPLRRAR